jgi:hypothetical protein
MNIPHELVIIANTCDMHELHEEADMLTHIAQILMQEERSKKMLNTYNPGEATVDVQMTAPVESNQFSQLTDNGSALSNMMGGGGFLK